MQGGVQLACVLGAGLGEAEEVLIMRPCRETAPRGSPQPGTTDQSCYSPGPTPLWGSLSLWLGQPLVTVVFLPLILGMGPT